MLSSTDWFNFFFSLPKFPPIAVLSYFFLALLRIAPIVSIAPFLGAKLPTPVKIGLALSLTFLTLPHVLLTASHPIGFDMEFILYGAKEIFIGAVLAFMAAMPFYIVESSGVLIDFMRGSSSLMVTDPTMQNQVSPIGILYNYVLIVLFFDIGGPFLFLDAFLQTYTLVPADALISASFFSAHTPLWDTLTGLLTKVTTITIQMAAPPIVAILMGEMFLGIANRLAPQVQIAFLGMSLKSLLGIALLFAGWFFVLQQMAKQSLEWLQGLLRLLSGAV